MLSDAGYRTAHGRQVALRRPAGVPARPDHGFDSYFGLPYSNDMGRQAGTPTDDRGHQRGYPPLPLLLDDEVLEQQPDQASLTARYLDEAVRVIRRRRRPAVLPVPRPHVRAPADLRPGALRPGLAQRRLRGGGRDDRLGHRRHPARAAGPRPRRVDDRRLHERQRLARRATAAATPRCAGRRARRGRAACGCRASCAGPVTSRRVARATSWRASIDLFPTLAALCGADVPADRTIDGVDISTLLLDDAGRVPRDAFWYYWMNDLEAVRAGRWKLHVARSGAPVVELYDVVDDPGESVDRAAERPDDVARLERDRRDGPPLARRRPARPRRRRRPPDRPGRPIRSR